MRFKNFLTESKRTKAGVLPYFIKNGAREFLFMVSSDPNFGGPDPMISKGNIGAGESPIQAALREGEEELGLKRTNIVDGTLVLGWAGDVSGLDERYRMEIYMCEVKSKTDFDTPHYETKETTWMDVDGAATKIRKSHRPIVTAIAMKLSDNIDDNGHL
jgi:8-oxo-dGTP pyrophosphatase MutT (NUDIX family)